MSTIVTFPCQRFAKAGERPGLLMATEAQQQPSAYADVILFN
jgi:hypothetical protein